MAKRRKFLDNLTSAEKELANFRLPDLKRQIIMRGYPFAAIGETGVLEMQQYFLANYHKPKDPDLLEKYDDWFDDYCKTKGLDPCYAHPALRLSSIAERDEDGKVIKYKRIGIKKKKKKRERTNDGLFTGTKKAYTYELVKEGNDKADIVEMVLEKYPEAKEKSIIIWINRAKRSLKK